MGLTIILADNLHRALSDLDGSARRRVVDFLIKLQTEPHSSGVRLKTIQNPRDPRVRTARVTDDLRAVLVHIGEEAYVVQTVLPHDDAYRYAEQLTCAVNKATGAVEMLETLRIEDKIDKLVTEPVPTGGPPALFTHVSDRDFERLGIPAIVVPALRRITDEMTLLDLVEPLPTLQQDILLSLVDRSPDQVYADIVAEASAGARTATDDVAEALSSPTNQSAYLVVTDAAELADALAWPMDRWRIYLHPTQRMLAYPPRPYSGPVRVTGGPGTGKTVVAVHRAKALADAAGPGERILVTTYGSTLARTLTDLLRRLAGEKIFERVEVLTVDALAARLVKRRVRTMVDDKCLSMLKMHLVQNGSDLDHQLVKDEWERVVIDQNLTSCDDYLAAPRHGRVRPLAVPQKRAIWEAIGSFTAWIEARRLATFPQVTAEAAAIMAVSKGKPYRHVIVDEAQDMTPVQWRLLRAVVPVAADDMFIVGDAHQRIYARTAVLSRQGIQTKGRSKRLTISYRTTREILRAGLVLLKGHHYDDLDAGTETLDGYRSLIHGPAPHVTGHQSPDLEFEELAARLVAWHEAGVTWDEMAVGVRTKYLADTVTAELTARGIPATVVTGDAADASGTAHVMTLHRLKGLEYRCVAVAGVRDGAVPPTALLDAAGTDQPARRTVLDRERSLLFVACTRAREALAVSWHQHPSPILAPLIVDAQPSVAG